MNLQTYCANFSFLSLLVSMIFYWIGVGIGGSAPKAYSPKAQAGWAFDAPLEYSQALPVFGEQGPKQAPLGNFAYWAVTLGRYGMILSNLLLGLLLLLRWKESGHFPLSNLYESLIFLSWCFTVIHLIIEKMTRDNTIAAGFAPPGKAVSNKPSQIGKLLGAITTPSALLTSAFATFTLPKEMQEASPLVPALQSNWLMMHVTVMILSYAALILGSLLSIAFLIVTANSKEDFSNLSEEVSSYKATETSFGSVDLVASQASLPIDQNKVLHKKDLPASQAKHPSSEGGALQQGNTSVKQSAKHLFALTLDNLSYRILGIGFPFLTIGILSGAVWANEAWGSYWSWDPKETWALLTWLIFAIYLHTRLNKGWEGKKPAMIASFGFVIVWICYLGVNLIGEGLHSYGWIVQG